MILSTHCWSLSLYTATHYLELHPCKPFPINPHTYVYHMARQSSLVSSRRNAAFRLVPSLGDRKRDGRSPPIFQCEHELHSLEICKIGCFLNGPFEDVRLTSDSRTLAWLLLSRRPLVVDNHDTSTRDPAASDRRNKGLIQELPQTFAELWCLSCCFVYQSSTELPDASSSRMNQAHSTHCCHLALAL